MCSTMHSRVATKEERILFKQLLEQWLAEGYYISMASTILLITVVKFYRNSQNETIFSIDVELLRASES
jgi:hypothetical protein